VANSVCTINVTRYLAYDDTSAFTGPWTVYFASGSAESASSSVQLAVVTGDIDTVNKTVQVRAVTVDDNGNATYTG
jgi:hypothetical protein